MNRRNGNVRKNIQEPRRDAAPMRHSFFRFTGKRNAQTIELVFLTFLSHNARSICSMQIFLASLKVVSNIPYTLASIFIVNVNVII